MANTTLFGALGLAETDRRLITQVGETNVYQAAAVTLAEHNANVFADLGFIVEATTEDWKINYKYAGGGRLQKLGNRDRAAEVKAGYQWSIGLPIENFGAGFAADRVTYAHMGLQDFNKVLLTVQAQDRNTVAEEVLRPIFNNVARTFPDDLRGDIVIQPLANGDGTLYPPTYGTDVPAGATAYLATSSNVSTTFVDASDPFLEIITYLESRHGKVAGGSPIVIFMNTAQASRAKLLTKYTPVLNHYITPGISADRVDLAGLPDVPGVIFGTHDDGALLVEWPRIPAGYLFGMHLGAPKPILQRVDMADTGLPRGLALVFEDVEHPFYKSEWIHRFGFGVGNRTNGVVKDLVTGTGTYAIPAAYATA